MGATELLVVPYLVNNVHRIKKEIEILGIIRFYQVLSFGGRIKAHR